MSKRNPTPNPKPAGSNSPKLHRPFRKLADLLDFREYPPGARIPSLRELADKLGTNKDYIAAALKMVEERGVIERAGFKRGYVRAGFSAGEAVERHHGVEAHILQEILEGHHSPGDRLPSAKVLQYRFGESPVRLRRSLEHLASTGIIVRSGRGFAVSEGPFAQEEPLARVHITGPTQIVKTFRAVTRDFLAPLELELRRLGWGPIEYFWSDDPLNGKGPRPERVAAFVAIRSAHSERWMRYFCKYPHIPLIAYDPAETRAWKKTDFPGHGKVFPIMPDNRSAGTAMAFYLLQAGHRRTVFLSHIPLPAMRGERRQLNWLIQRLQGIREIYADLGGQCREIVYSGQAETSSSPMTFSDETTKLNWRKYLPPEIVRLETHSLEVLEDACRIAHSMRPYFEAALEEKRATCWICVNDTLAACALEFLRGRGKSVPEDIGLAGFDNSLAAYALGITSYDFRIDRAGILAARCLAHPQAVALDPEGHTHLKGKLMIRNSSRRMPG